MDTITNHCPRCGSDRLADHVLVADNDEGGTPGDEDVYACVLLGEAAAEPPAHDGTPYVRRYQPARQFSPERRSVAIVLPFSGRDVDVDITGPDHRFGSSKLGPAEINWPSIGASCIEDTLAFSSLLAYAAGMAHSLSGPIGVATETDPYLTCWSYSATGGLSGISPFGPAEFIRRVAKDGHAIVTGRAWDHRPLNHNIIGIGVGHNDARFAESGESMAAYYENGEAFGGRWWEDTASSFSNGVKYYGCRPTGQYPPCGRPTPEAETIRRRGAA